MKNRSDSGLARTPAADCRGQLLLAAVPSCLALGLGSLVRVLLARQKRVARRKAGGVSTRLRFRRASFQFRYRPGLTATVLRPSEFFGIERALAITNRFSVHRMGKEHETERRCATGRQQPCATPRTLARPTSTGRATLLPHQELRHGINRRQIELRGTNHRQRPIPSFDCIEGIRQEHVQFAIYSAVIQNNVCASRR